MGICAVSSSTAAVYQGEGLSKNEFIRKYPTVFVERLGLFSGELHLEINSRAKPTKGTAWRVPVPSKKPMRKELEELGCGRHRQ